jgi:hypothetical protein
MFANSLLFLFLVENVVAIERLIPSPISFDFFMPDRYPTTARLPAEAQDKGVSTCDRASKLRVI